MSSVFVFIGGVIGIIIAVVGILVGRWIYNNVFYTEDNSPHLVSASEVEKILKELKKSDEQCK